MKPFIFESTQTLPTSIETAWDFFSDPGNLARITPPAMDFRITSPHQTTTYAGQILTYTLRPLFGISMTWTTEITHVARPDFFVDEQRFGPYRVFGIINISFAKLPKASRSGTWSTTCCSMISWPGW